MDALELPRDTGTAGKTRRRVIYYPHEISLGDIALEESETSGSLPITRRAAIAGVALIPVAAIQAAPQNVTQVLAPEQRRILSALVDRIIPKDELGPSATECGVEMSVTSIATQRGKRNDQHPKLCQSD